MDSGTVLLHQSQASNHVSSHVIEFSDSEEDNKYFIVRSPDVDIKHFLVEPAWPSTQQCLAVLRRSFSL